MVKLLACGARGLVWIPGLAATISRIGYLLLPSHDMAEIVLKQRKSSLQPTLNYHIPQTLIIYWDQLMRR